MPKATSKISPFPSEASPAEAYIHILEMSEGDYLDVSADDFLILWMHNGILSLALGDGHEAIFIVGNDVLILNEPCRITVSHVYDYSKIIALVIHKKELERAIRKIPYVLSSSCTLEKRMAVLSRSSSLYHYPESMEILFCVDLLIKDFSGNCTADDNSIILTDVFRLLGQIAYLETSSILSISTASNVKVTAQVMNYIRHHYSTATLHEIAEKLHYHPNYLSHLLVRTCGMTFKDLLNARRSIVGRTLLIQTNYSLTEISAMLGFQSYSGFYRAFKKKFHTTPYDYRETRKSSELNLSGFELSLKR